jgi:predicted transcriptional regulator
MARTSSASAAEAALGALSRRTGRTAAEIAEAAGIGRSTATKALTALEADDKARRTPGGRDGGRRLPDRWSLPPASGTRGVRTATGGSRLAKGELAGMVLAHLRGNREAGLTPTAVAKALGGKSAGAVGNALERLVAAGDIVKVAERPRTYQARSGKAGKK